MKIRANRNCAGSGDVSVYLDGEKLLDVFEVDEGAGTAWVEYKDVAGGRVMEEDAEPGAHLHAGLQVIKIRGPFEVRLTPGDDVTDEELRRMIDGTFVSLEATGEIRRKEA
jgi:hypothetical protein